MSNEPGAAAPGVAPWADDQTRQHLQVLVEGVATLAGFEQSAIRLRRDGVFEVLVAAGVSPDFVGTQISSEAFEHELDNADEWGVWRFVPHHRASAESLAHSHIPDVTPLDRDDAWHPLDMLAAPLLDDDGRIRGVLSVDSPRNGRLPGTEQLAVLSQYAGVARTLVLLALERETLAERVRMADEAREIVRRALGEPSLELVLEACRSAVTSCFGAVGMWPSAATATPRPRRTPSVAMCSPATPTSTTWWSSWPTATGPTSTSPTSRPPGRDTPVCRRPTPSAC